MTRRGQRRSARISALQGICGVGDPTGRGEGKGKQIVEVEEEEEEFGQDLDNVQELPEKKRGIKKRKLRTFEEVVVSSVEQQESDIPKHEHQPFNTGQSSTSLPTSGVPEKRLLELILEILEERDWGKVFADPVDPNEVEGYYEIIKEPMDFGTMKAKLNHGMYTTLDAFKHDVFLVSGNAMHFNASNTYYFRQGSAINDLAKRIFNTLRTDHEDYEVALSSLRIRRGRKPGSLSKVSKNVRPNNINGGAPRSRTCSSYGSSILKRNIQACTGPSSPSPRFDKKDYENHYGFKDNGKSIISEEDSRQTFKPWRYFLNIQEDIASMVYEIPKQLVNEGGIRYSESLMTFVKDLGPTAQMVAKRKLQTRQVGANNCQISAPSTQQRPNPPIRIINIPASQKIPPNFSGHPIVSTNSFEKQDTPSAFRGEMGDQRQSSGTCVNIRNLNFSINGTPNSGNGNLRMVDFSKLDDQVPPIDLPSKLSPTKLLDFICRRNNGFMPSSSRFQAMRESNPSQASSSVHEVGTGSMPLSSCFHAMRESNPSQSSSSVHELGASSMPSSPHFQRMRGSTPSQTSGSIQEFGSSSMPSSSHFQGMRESNPVQASNSIHELKSSSMPPSTFFQAIGESYPSQASGSIQEIESTFMPLSSSFQGTLESKTSQASGSIHLVGSSSKLLSPGFQGMRESNPIQASGSIHELRSSFIPSSSRFQGTRESNPRQTSGSIHEVGSGSMPSPSRYQGTRKSNSSQASGSSIHELGSSSLSRENHAFTTPGSSYRFSPSQASEVPKLNQCSLGSHSLDGYQNQVRAEQNPTLGIDSVMLGQVLEWNRCNMGSNSFCGENLQIAAPGPSPTINSVEAEQVLDWNRSNVGLHSFGGERDQAKVEDSQTYMPNSSLPGQDVDWNRLSLGSNPFTIENLTIAKPGPNCIVNSTEAEPIMKWNQPNLGTHYFGGDNVAMVSAPDPSCAVSLAETQPVNEWNGLSLGSLSLNGENQALDANGLLYGVNSAQFGSVQPDWNQQNMGSHSFGGEHQAMDTSSLGYPVEMTSERSSVQECNQNQQRQCNPQPQALIDISYLQNGFRQLDLRLDSVPEDAVLEPMRLYGRAPTHHSHHQAELNTLPLLDNQQPDLALQL